MLVEVGAADPCLTDRWQQTPLDEASRAGALPVVHYLSTKVPGELRQAGSLGLMLCFCKIRLRAEGLASLA